MVYLNKKIEMYDDLAIVVRKDMATGSFAKSYVDIDTEQDNGESTKMVVDNGEEGVVEKGKNVVESSITGSTISKSRKRGRAPPSDDNVLTDLSDQLKEIAMALKEINQGPIYYNSLYSKVMAMVVDRYSEDMLATAFGHLCENDKAAKGFLAKNAKLRKFWMDGYLFTRFWLVCLVLTMMVALGIVIYCRTSIHLSLYYICDTFILSVSKLCMYFKPWTFTDGMYIL